MKSKTRKIVVALKLEISKAYDWEYLRGVMDKMGFSTQQISRIMLYVKTIDYSVIVNGNGVRLIIPYIGL